MSELLFLNGVNIYAPCNSDGLMSIMPPTGADALKLTVQLPGKGFAPSEKFEATVTIPVAKSPIPKISNVVHRATLQPGMLVPGMIFALSGKNLGDAAMADAPPSQNYALGRASVSFCGIPAALLSNSGPQGAAPGGDPTWVFKGVVPPKVSGNESCTVQVSTTGTDGSQDLFSDPVMVQLSTSNWGLFTQTTPNPWGGDPFTVPVAA